MKCEGHPWRYRERECDAPATRTRRNSWTGVLKHYCAEHDPERIDAEEKNAKARKESKRDRWRAIERERGNR